MLAIRARLLLTAWSLYVGHQLTVLLAVLSAAAAALHQASVDVHNLSPDELVKYGGLQPVSCRVLLQQLLRGMVLSLTMSSRLEEALLLLR